MNSSLCIVGLAYFELSIPRPAQWPQPGQEVFLNNEMKTAVGGALNTARAARMHGWDPFLMVPLGKGLCDLAIKTTLDDEGFRYQTFSGKDNSAASIAIWSENDRAFLSQADFEALSLNCPEIPPKNWIHVPGLLEARALVDRLGSAKSKGAKISVSGSWALDALQDLSHMDSCPWDILFLNQIEAETACGSPEKAIEKLSHQAAQSVIVTLGTRGAIAKIEGQVFQLKANLPVVENPTGAGDAFVAAAL